MKRLYFRMSLAAFALAGVSSAAMAENAFTLTIKDHRFEPSELRVPADQGATLTVKNLDADSGRIRKQAVAHRKGDARQ